MLDEPANGLDPQGIRWLRTFLRQLAAEGRTVLVSSHVLPEVEQTADDVLVLAEGRLVKQGTLAELGAGRPTGRPCAAPTRARLVELLTAAGLPGTLDQPRRAAGRRAAGARRGAGRRARVVAAPAVGDRAAASRTSSCTLTGEARA